jgi:hypothetical protein
MRESPIFNTQDPNAITIDQTTGKSDPNYNSFVDFGSYSRAAISGLIEGNILVRLDQFPPARSVFAKFPWIREVRSCSLGMVLKKRNIAATHMQQTALRRIYQQFLRPERLQANWTADGSVLENIARDASGLLRVPILSVRRHCLAFKAQDFFCRQLHYHQTRHVSRKYAII